jgi:pimeloyl-ACP methyl ester carboxylesterase
MADRVNGRLHWVQLGNEGRPIVFVHPNPTDVTCWVYQMAHLSYWFRTIAIDLPGYGKSPTVESGVTMDDIAEACWAAVDEAVDGPVVLGGLSVGSHMVLHMRERRPQQTSALILSGTGYSTTLKPFAAGRIAAYAAQGVAFRRQHFSEILSEGFRDTPLARYFADIFMERNVTADAFTIQEMFRALAEPDDESLYADVHVPTLIITGTEDGTHPGALELVKHIPGCELVKIVGAGHACNMERPWEFDTAMLDFLERHGLFERRR